jgi:hypothetical protein
MEARTRDGTTTIKLMEEEELFMLMVMFTRANGVKIKHMDMEPICTWMEQSMRVNGSKTSKRVKV